MADETPPASAGDGGGGSAGEAAAGATGEVADAGAMGMLEPPWNEHSRHVELDCFGFFKGSMSFEADRDELSAEQLRSFEGLQPAESNDECRSDELGCGFAITSDRGEVTLYAADEDDAFCGLAPALSYASVEPLLALLRCKFALQSAAPLAASTGCLHGLHASTSAAVIHQQLSLSEANRSYHVELVHCLSGEVTLELVGGDPSFPLAVGMPVVSPGPKGACVALDVEVPRPITADLVITTSALSDPADFYLNFL
ncbi:MAG TPA: hypothetical protein VGC79_03730 [Polyangiaceae bacterium]